MKKSFLVLVLLALTSMAWGQNKNYEIGSMNPQMQHTNGGFYDYSDPTDVNIKVSVWGFVRYPGKYVVPIYTNVLDLLSYAGGPSDNAHLDDLRIYRVFPDSTQKIYKFDINDIWWGEKLESDTLKIPQLKAGDILSIPGSQKYYLRDWLSMVLSIFSALTSLAILLTR